MAEIKVSELPSASGINNEDLFLIVQDGNSKKILASNLGLNGGDAYTLEETPIGSWVDGKTIYRQIFVGDDNNPFTRQQTLMTGVDHCIKQYGFIQSKINVGAPVEKEFVIPTYDQQDLNGYCNVYVDKQHGNSPLILNYYGNRGQTFGYIVVEYTKV